MALITIDEVDAAGARQFGQRISTKAAASILKENREADLDHEFDAFLSHSYADAKLDMSRLMNLKAFLESFRIDVYVDWLVDANLERENVSAETAALLRHRMNHSRCLLFATSERSHESKWMPWELGYMDAKTKRVAVLPLAASPGSLRFAGQEYLGIYPYIDKATASGTNTPYLWVGHNEETYVRFDLWLAGQNPHKH